MTDTAYTATLGDVSWLDFIDCGMCPMACLPGLKKLTLLHPG